MDSSQNLLTSKKHPSEKLFISMIAGNISFQYVNEIEA